MKWSLLYLFILCFLFTISIKPQDTKQSSDTSGNIKFEAEEISAIKEEINIAEDSNVMETNSKHTYINERFIPLRHNKFLYKSYGKQFPKEKIHYFLLNSNSNIKVFGLLGRIAAKLISEEIEEEDSAPKRK